MSAIENVNIGDYILLIGMDYRQAQQLPSSVEYEYIEAIDPFNPLALHVKAFSAPYILCETVLPISPDAYSKHTGYLLDSRHEHWTKCNEDFVRELLKLHGLGLPDELQRDEDETPSVERLCPICSAGLSERLLKPGKWTFACKRCNMQFVPI